LGIYVGIKWTIALEEFDGRGRILPLLFLTSVVVAPLVLTQIPATWQFRYYPIWLICGYVAVSIIKWWMQQSAITRKQSPQSS
jgi:hypothetical protein